MLLQLIINSTFFPQGIFKFEYFSQFTSTKDVGP